MAAVIAENVGLKVDGLVNGVEISRQNTEQLIALVKRDQENTSEIIECLLKIADNKTI